MAGGNFLLPVSLVFEGDTDGTAARRNSRLLLDLVKHAQLDGRMVKDPSTIPAGRPVVVVLDLAAKDHTASVKQIVGRVGAGLVQCVVTAPAADESISKIPATIAGAKVVKLRIAEAGRMLDADAEALRTVKATLCTALPEDHPHRRAFTVPRDLTKEPNPFMRTASGHAAAGSSPTRTSRSTFADSRAGSESLRASPSRDPLDTSSKPLSSSSVRLHIDNDDDESTSVPPPPSGAVSAAYVRMVQRRRQRRDIRVSGSVSACGSDGAFSPPASGSFAHSPLQDALDAARDVPAEATAAQVDVTPTVEADPVVPMPSRVSATPPLPPPTTRAATEPPRSDVAAHDAPDSLSDSATFSTAPCSAATELARDATTDPEDQNGPATGDELMPMQPSGSVPTSLPAPSESAPASDRAQQANSASATAPTTSNPTPSAAPAAAAKPRSPTPERARSPSPVSTIAPGDTPRSKHATAGQSPVQQSPVPHVLVDDVDEQSNAPVTPHVPNASASTAPPTPSVRAPERHRNSGDAQEPHVHLVNANGAKPGDDDAVQPAQGGCMHCICM